jgi:5-methylthioadenosine/S-adenosylhomocysteine deaminase
MAPLLGGSGRIAEGEPADFLLVRTDTPELAVGEFTADLVYAASGSVVDTTVVNGRVLMRGGVVPGADEVVAKARERSERLGLS